MRFDVTLVNNTTTDFAQVGMVVSVGHCSCSPTPGPQMMPAGSMRMLDPNANTWVTVPYVREGTGMDYIYQDLVPPFSVTPGQTVTYQLEMQLDAEQNFTVGTGETSINVTLTDPASQSADRLSDTSSLRIAVEP
jgi:hypothetical protein